jgi:hypothetical protein
MNELNLPPRRELPDDVRDRIRTAVHAESPPARTSRWRAPLAVAAGVAALVAATLVIVRPADDLQVGTQPPVPVRSGDLTLTQPDAKTDKDLDRCAAVVAKSPQAHKYTPRDTWAPVFTVHRDILEHGPMTPDDIEPPSPTKVGEARVVAFRQAGDQPVFCEIYQDTVTLSDPNPDYPLVTLAKNDDADIHVVFMTHRTNIMFGVAQGVTALDSKIVPYHDLRQVSENPAALVQDGLFALQTDKLVTQDRVEVVGLDSAKAIVVSGGHAFDQSIIWPAGAAVGEG